MQPWIESGAVVGTGLAALAAAAFLARRSMAVWFGIWLAALVVVCFMGLAYRFRPLEFHPPFSWLMQGWREVLIAAPIAALLLGIPAARLPRHRERRGLFALIALFGWHASVWPLLAPAFNRSTLERFQTRLDADGVCLQNSDYTCGPAAAVTALRRLGIGAEEGAIAIEAGTSSALGTPPDILAATLDRLYGAQGLRCQFRPFRAVEELGDAIPTLAVVRFSLLLDHYVTVLECDERYVTVGDPLVGKTVLTHEEFAKRWRFVGVTMGRETL